VRPDRGPSRHVRNPVVPPTSEERSGPFPPP
jgi:hypothetical protein